MKAHHVLMVEKGKDGGLIPHEVPNNEWAGARRKGWEFATAEQQADYAEYRAEAANRAAMDKAEAADEAEGEAEGEAEPKGKRGGRQSANAK